MAANKYISNNSGTLTETQATDSSAGAGDSGKIVALDANGQLALNMMPTGIGPDVATITASENLALGDLVNIWDDAGTPKVRKADASSVSTRAMGFVKAAVTSGNPASVYFEGNNPGLTGLTAGVLYLSETAGAVTATAPTTSGAIVQLVGVATSATSMNAEFGTPIVLA